MPDTPWAKTAAASTDLTAYREARVIPRPVAPFVVLTSAASIDPPSDSGGKSDMADTPTRNEIDAKLEAAEARTATALARIDGKLDRLFDRVEVAIQQTTEAKASAEAARQEAIGARTASQNVKWNVVATGLVVVGILLAAWAIWVQGIEMVSGIFGAITGTSNPPTP